MTQHIQISGTYFSLLGQVKKRVAIAQQRAIYAANEEMLRMYWDIGQMLDNSQRAEGWGKGTLERLAIDLKNALPEEKGFSARNLRNMTLFYHTYNQELTGPNEIWQSMTAKLEHNNSEIVQSVISQLESGDVEIVKPLVAELEDTKSAEMKSLVAHDKYKGSRGISGKIPAYNFELPIKHLSWTHNLTLIQKVPDLRARYWYMVQCIKGHWNVRYLAEVIDRDDYHKHGALANNFAETLPAPQAEEVQSLLKDPYIFDMLTFTDKYNERDVEIELVKHVQQFLIEMGAGFAFMGNQYHIEVSGDDYYMDMLMYNTFLHRYMVVELKDTEFRPEYIGKLNFYCSAVDDTLCREGDEKTIGLLLCRQKDRIKAEYALRDIQKPIGISDYELGQALPKDFRGSLPTIEEIERELGEINEH